MRTSGPTGRKGTASNSGAAGTMLIAAMVPAVMPEQDAVVAITAETGNMQGELNAIWDHLLPAFHPKALPPSTDGQEKLNQAIAGLEAHPKKKVE